MAKVVTPETSDDEIRAILDELDLTNPDSMRSAMKEATPKQAFMVAMPYGLEKQPDIKSSLAGIDGSVLWVIEGEGGGKYAMIFSGGDMKVEEGDKPDATATVTVDMQTWKELLSGETNPQAAFMAGKVQIEGDLSLLMQIQGVMPAM
jgi:ubiquinone biosynthesis protein UbiJ